MACLLFPPSLPACVVCCHLDDLDELPPLIVRFTSPAYLHGASTSLISLSSSLSFCEVWSYIHIFIVLFVYWGFRAR